MAFSRTREEAAEMILAAPRSADSQAAAQAFRGIRLYQPLPRDLGSLRLCRKYGLLLIALSTFLSIPPADKVGLSCPAQVVVSLCADRS